MVFKIITRRSGASPLIGIYSIFSTMSKYIPKILKLKQDLDFYVEFRNKKSRMIVDGDIWYNAGLMAMKKMQSPEYVQEIIFGLVSEKVKLTSYGNKLLKTDFEFMSNDELAKTFQKAMLRLEKFNSHDARILAAEFYHELFTKQLNDILEKVCKNTGISVNEANVIFTTSTELSWVQKQEEDFLKMLAAYSKHNAQVNELLASHLEKYFWIQYEQEGELLNKEYFLNLLSEAVMNKINPELELSKIAEKRKKLIDRQNELKNAISMSPEEEHWFYAATKLMFWKLHLREVKIRFYSCTERLMKEIAKRLGLDKTQIRHMSCEEITKALKNSKADTNLLNERIKYCVIHFYKGIASYLVGKQAAAISNQLQETDTDSIGKIKGSCACQGYAKGIVKQVLKPEDMVKFNHGDILVAYMTDPGVVPAMKKAAAIVTDVGGITCHAAIVSREFGIPCVIGTHIATEVLKDGDLVEVDANKGTVRILGRISSSNKL